MLWACLHFSDLPLHAVFEDSEQALPCAVVDGPRQRQHIVLANAPAQRNAVCARTSRWRQRARCARRCRRERAIRPAEQRLLLSLAAWAYRFSSHVSLSEPDALLIEVGASLRLFGGWPALERRLRRELARIGYAPAIAVAPHARGRARARRAARRFLHRPARTDADRARQCSARRVPVSTTMRFHFYTMSACARCAMYSPCRARNWRGASGRRHWRRSIACAASIRKSCRCTSRRIVSNIASNSTTASKRGRRCCFRCAACAANWRCSSTARDGGVQRCELVLDHEDTPATRVVVELLTPQREARTLYELVRSRLERVALAQPVCGIALIATDLPTLRPQHQDLFEPRARARPGLAGTGRASARASRRRCRAPARRRRRSSARTRLVFRWQSQPIAEIARARYGCCRARCRCADPHRASSPARSVSKAAGGDCATEMQRAPDSYASSRRAKASGRGGQSCHATACARRRESRAAGAGEGGALRQRKRAAFR